MQIKKNNILESSCSTLVGHFSNYHGHRSRLCFILEEATEPGSRLPSWRGPYAERAYGAPWAYTIGETIQTLGGLAF